MCSDPNCKFTEESFEFYRLVHRLRILLESMQPDRYEDAIPYDVALNDVRKIVDEVNAKDAERVLASVAEGQRKEEKDVPF